MAKRTWNFGIVGPGWVAGAYVSAFRKRDDIRVTHIVGRTVGRAAKFAEQWDIDCPLHDDVGDAVGDKSLDIVGIFTPHHLHARPAVAAAKAGKHLIIEKPVCLSPRELQAMRAAVKAAKVKTIVGFVLRWNPLLRMIRKNIAEGNLGKII
ncbi:MAG: Gfo/Idh/MocA family oxidoreductase, partial [bacterium]|nr:Gfo/Idh/MocA family oxidoreductase [bacterium]